MKKTLYSEVAYIFGLLFLTLGTSLMAKADFGVSMVVAPAYILYLKLSEIWSFFSFGMAGYMVEGVLLVVLALLTRRFRPAYLFSFVTAVLYGLLLDTLSLPVGLIPGQYWPVRVLCYVAGLPLVSAGVAMMFNTYVPPEAYDLFVKELSATFRFSLTRTKTVYDCTSCLVAVVLSFALFGLWQFKGVGWGTVLCALVNGHIIGRFSRLYNRHFEFVDRFALRKHME